MIYKEHIINDESNQKVKLTPQVAGPTRAVATVELHFPLPTSIGFRGSF